MKTVYLHSIGWCDLSELSFKYVEITGLAEVAVVDRRTKVRKPGCLCCRVQSNSTTGGRSTIRELVSPAGHSRVYLRVC